METARNNKHFGISYYADTFGISGQPFTFSILSKPVLFGKMDTVKGVSVQPDWTLYGFNQSVMELIRFIADRGNWNKKSRMEVNC